jgi:hypothetical protein
MTCPIQEHPMVARFRTDPRLGKPPYGYGTPHFASHGPPRLDPLKPPLQNPNEFYYVSPGGGLKLTLGQLTGIGRMISDDEWLRILCGWSLMQYAHSMGLSGGSPNSVDQLIEWLNKNTRLGLPDYTAACLDMYYAGLGVREGFLVLGGATAVRPKVEKPYPLEYRAEGRSYSRDTAGRYGPKLINKVPHIFFDPAQLQAKFKHAADFGVHGNWDKMAGMKFENAIRRHVYSPETKKIVGTYEFSEELFDILDSLFVAVDEYCGDQELRKNMPNSLDEQGLFEVARIASDKLKTL